MILERGYKLVLSKEKGKSSIEITKHKVSYMDNILIINSKGSTKYQDVWIIEKDLDTWIKGFEKEGFTIIKKLEDDGSNKKDIQKKK